MPTVFFVEELAVLWPASGISVTSWLLKKNKQQHQQNKTNIVITAIIKKVASVYMYKQVTPLGVCVYQENTSDKWDIPLHTRESILLRLFLNKGL